MKGNEILALLDEPACEHNHKQKPAARAKPGATAGGCAFDGAQITLRPSPTWRIWSTARSAAPEAHGITAAAAAPPHP